MWNIEQLVKSAKYRRASWASIFRQGIHIARVLEKFILGEGSAVHWREANKIEKQTNIHPRMQTQMNH